MAKKTGVIQKLTLPSKKAESIISGTGAYKTGNANPNTKIPNSYSGSAIAYTNQTKTAQALGANVTYTAPMFFSPLHSPQNWQIASKKRECSQWMYHIDSPVLTEDFTYRSILDFSFVANSVVEDTITEGMLYEDLRCENIYGATGEFRHPEKIGIRDCINKDFYKIKAFGYFRELNLSEEHEIFTIDKESYRKNIPIKQRGNNQEKINGDKLVIENELFVKKQAKDIKKGDYLIFPIPSVGKTSINKDLAWLIGLCLADGCIGKIPQRKICYTMHRNEPYKEKLINTIKEQFKVNPTSKFHASRRGQKDGDGNAWRVSFYQKEAHSIYSKYITGKHGNKKFTKNIFNLDRRSRLNVLAGYIDGDGHYSKEENRIVIKSHSLDMADQIRMIRLSCGIKASVSKSKIFPSKFPTKNTHKYIIIISASNIHKVKRYLKSGKVAENFKSKKQGCDLRFFFEKEDKTYLASPVRFIEKYSYTGKGYDIQIDPERALVVSGAVCSNCRFYYRNDPKVAAGIDFYSTFPLTNFDLECKSKKVLRYYEKLVKDLKIPHWLRMVSHEYYLLGDVYVFMEFECKVCGGAGINPSDGTYCNHPGGKPKRILVLNPDWIEVQSNVLADEPLVVLLPDEELRSIVARKQPAAIYNKLPKRIIEAVMAGMPIPLSNRSITHLKHAPSPYGVYGESILRRLFTILAYGTKLMTANWIVAERLILPIRVVKIGDKERPASDDDIASVTSQLAVIANDPNLTLVTHHAFDMDWIGYGQDT